MDRRRTESPVYTRQWSGDSSSTRSSSPAMSPAHPQSRLGPTSTGLSTVKRTQIVVAKAAALRLTRIMASQTITTDDGDEDDDDLEVRFSNPRPPPALSSFSNNNSNNNSLKSSSASSTIPPISLARPNRFPSPSVILVAIVPYELVPI
ncbi:hypothetical protein RIF29_10668 [Crotalaria pallida]|uniref:Uncharacterized protein n=1 Tax=Crotalaria pallida TaxID=3830 RepID=A0AAN9FT36_CROPI